MKKWIWAPTLLLAGLCLAACHRPVPGTTATTLPIPTTTAPHITQPTTTLPPTTAAPVLTGWQEIGGNLYYYDASGTPLLLWQELDGQRYYFGVDGVMRTGWLELEGVRYYLGADGAMVTGFANIDGVTYYFAEDGLPGAGWLEVDRDRYYLQQDGSVHTGWLELEGVRYYLRTDGTMAKGCVEVDGVKHYFTSEGAYILLVNPWNYVPQDYDPDLVKLDRFAAYNNMSVSRACYDALVQMLSDCKAQCGSPLIVSSYRTHEFQAGNYERKVQYYINLGYDRAEAEVLAAKVVAVPGTSEHQLGLALDIVDASWPYLEEAQENKPVQKWLMEHSWEYGFILRYPKNTTDVTGIIYEPWHYRYVGVDVAKELHDSGLTLEEYLDSLTRK